jgi:hypothetical protein
MQTELANINLFFTFPDNVEKGGIDKIEGQEQRSGCPTQYVKFLQYEKTNYDTIW